MRCPVCQGFASADLMNLAMHILSKSDKPHTDWLEQFELRGETNGKGRYESCRSLAEILRKIALREDDSSTTRERVRETVKEYECVQVDHHEKIAEKIQEYLMNGWRLHTYQATGQATLVTHYLLFERG